MLPPTLLLDLDDTIVDDTIAAHETWATLARRYAFEIAPASPGELVNAIARIRRWFWDDPERNAANRLRLNAARREIVTQALTELNVVNAADIGARIAEDYSTQRLTEMRLLPGSQATLDSLRARGVRMGLITNGKPEIQRAKVERFRLTDYFQVIVIEGEFGCGKPDERVYRHALTALNATPAETWMVGDNLINDVLAPQRLGMAGVWINADGRELPANAPERPARIIRALAELLESKFQKDGRG